MAAGHGHGARDRKAVGSVRTFRCGVESQQSPRHPIDLGALLRKLARYVAVGAAADYFFDIWRRRGLTSLIFNTFPVD